LRSRGRIRDLSIVEVVSKKSRKLRPVCGFEIGIEGEKTGASCFLKAKEFSCEMKYFRPRKKLGCKEKGIFKIEHGLEPSPPHYKNKGSRGKGNQALGSQRLYYIGGRALDIKVL